jgi:hypothetical protein
MVTLSLDFFHKRNKFYFQSDLLLIIAKIRIHILIDRVGSSEYQSFSPADGHPSTLVLFFVDRETHLLRKADHFSYPELDAGT